MSIWSCSSPANYCQSAVAAGFIYCISQEWALHSPSPAGFVCLEFSWTRAPFVFSSIQPYLPVAIAVLLYLEFVWRSSPPPLSCGVCHTLAAVGRFPLSKHTGEVVSLPPSLTGLFIYKPVNKLPLPPFSGAFHRTVTVTNFPYSKFAGQGAANPVFSDQLVFFTICMRECLWSTL
jgi:hypothetical protein